MAPLTTLDTRPSRIPTTTAISTPPSCGRWGSITRRWSSILWGGLCDLWKRVPVLSSRYYYETLQHPHPRSLPLCTTGILACVPEHRQECLWYKGFCCCLCPLLDCDSRGPSQPLGNETGDAPSRPLRCHQI